MSSHLIPSLPVRYFYLQMLKTEQSKNQKWLIGFNCISTSVSYLMPNHIYTCILNIYDLVWLVFMAYQPL